MKALSNWWISVLDGMKIATAILLGIALICGGVLGCSAAFFFWLSGPSYSTQESEIRFSERIEALRQVEFDGCVPQIGELERRTVNEREELWVDGVMEFPDGSIRIGMSNRGDREDYHAAMTTAAEPTPLQALSNETALLRMSVVSEALSGGEHPQQEIFGMLKERTAVVKERLANAERPEETFENSFGFQGAPSNRVHVDIEPTESGRYALSLVLWFQ